MRNIELIIVHIITTYKKYLFKERSTKSTRNLFLREKRNKVFLTKSSIGLKLKLSPVLHYHLYYYI